jgi:hypothetical protein
MPFPDPFKKGNPFVLPFSVRDGLGNLITGLASSLNNRVYIKKDELNYTFRHDSTSVWESLMPDGTTGSGTYNVIFDSTDAYCDFCCILIIPVNSQHSPIIREIFMQRNSLYDIVSSIPPRGVGAKEVEIEVLDNQDLPVSNVDVWITADLAGAALVAGTLVTDGNGKAKFFLDIGTYYVWRTKTAVEFTNPQMIVIT